MEPVKMMEDYIGKLKAADKDLKRQEKAAKKLSEKQAAADEQRYTLEASITDHQRGIAAKESEREQLKGDFVEAQFENDVQEQRRITTRRQEIDGLLQDHEQAIEELEGLLEALPTFEQESAELSKELGALSFGEGWAFARRLEPVLQQHKNGLQARQSEAKSNLPAFTEATRRAVDGAYREHREREEARQAAAEEKRREDEAKAKLTNKVVRDDDGIVIGVRSFNENGTFVKYTPAKMVSRTG